MHTAFPRNTSGINVDFNCLNCRTRLRLTIPVTERLGSSKLRRDKSKLFKGILICTDSECKHKHKYTLDFGKDQYSIEIPGVLEEEIDLDPIEDPYFDFFDDQLDAIQASEGYFDTFKRELDNLRKLNALTQNDAGLNSILKRQIYIASIACLETYLSETFINLTLGDQKLLRKFVKTFPAFKNQKFELSEVFDKHDIIEETARQAMGEVIFHNLEKVNRMYQDVLDINFPNMKDVLGSIRTRHDLVHRNGKRRDGSSIALNSAVVSTVLSTIEKFVTEIEKQIKKITSMANGKAKASKVEDSWDDLPF